MEIEIAKLGFQSISTAGNKLFTDCVGALDGFLLSTFNPNYNVASKGNKFFNGHHQTTGLNIQGKLLLLSIY